jgi:predicted PhzF superfamily epimerase YddE/YHI9
LKLPLYQIDAFTNMSFTGNPACVVPLDEWLSYDVLLNIAKEPISAHGSSRLKYYVS